MRLSALQYAANIPPLGLIKAYNAAVEQRASVDYVHTAHFFYATY